VRFPLDLSGFPAENTTAGVLYPSRAHTGWKNSSLATVGRLSLCKKSKVLQRQCRPFLIAEVRRFRLAGYVVFSLLLAGFAMRGLTAKKSYNPVAGHRFYLAVDTSHTRA